MKIMTMRIVGVRAKVIFFAVWIAFNFVRAFFENLFLTPSATILLDNVFVVALCIFAVRNFRGKNEVLVTPRTWWRATAQPKSGFVVAVCAASCIIYFIRETFSQHAAGTLRNIDGAQSLLIASIVFLLFLNSSIQQVRSRRRDWSVGSLTPRK